MADNKHPGFIFLLTVSVSLIVIGIGLYMIKSTSLAYSLIFIGLALLLLMMPIIAIAAIISKIKNRKIDIAKRERINETELVIRTESCKWKNHTIDIKVTELPKECSFYKIYIYVDNELVSQANLERNLEKAKGCFRHENKEIYLEVEPKTSLLNDFFGASSRNLASLYFLLHIDGDIQSVGMVDMPARKLKYWSFVLLLIFLLTLVIVVLPPYVTVGQRVYFTFWGILCLWGSIVFWIKSKEKKGCIH